MSNKTDYDVIVVGSGIAGSTTALALSQAGIKTLVVELSKHPRFVIGESTVPFTTYQFEQIGKRWNIPELKHLTRYVPWKKHTPPLADYPKGVFWFGLHEENEPLKLSSEILIETFDPPIGPDTHIRRDKYDEYLVSLFPKYKVEYLDRTVVQNYSRDKNKICHLTLNSRSDEKKRQVTCRFIVDATGHNAFFSKKLGFFDENCDNLKTNTRGIYGHFKSDSMPDLDEVLGGPGLLFRLKRNAGTMHHCFNGGWIWGIPFDDGTTSIGIVLDRTIYPDREDLTAKEEFFSIINRFPSVKAHLGNVEPIMPFIRKPRLQIMSRRIIGDGVIITPHAAAFIDALFSTGMALTSAFVGYFVPMVQEAFKKRDYGMEQFEPIEEAFFRDIYQIDTIVAGTIESFRHIEVFKQYWKIWVCSIFYNVGYHLLMRDKKFNIRFCALYGSNNETFRNDVNKMWSILIDGKDEDQVKVAIQLKKIIDKHWIASKSHPYDKFMGEVEFGHPFKPVFKLTVFHFFLRLIKEERKHIFLPKIIFRIIKLRIYLKLGKLLFKIRAFFQGDEFRINTINAQRLPWYDEKLLK